jgi:hypothetical protein
MAIDGKSAASSPIENRILQMDGDHLYDLVDIQGHCFLVYSCPPGQSQAYECFASLALVR